MQPGQLWPRQPPASRVGTWLHQPIGCASRPRRTAELQLWERQLAGARSQTVEGRNSMRLDDRRELEGQLAAAEQRQSAPVGAVQNPVDSFIRTPLETARNGSTRNTSGMKRPG